MSVEKLTATRLLNNNYGKKKKNVITEEKSAVTVDNIVSPALIVLENDTTTSTSSSTRKTTNLIPICKSCGSTTHKTSRSSECPHYKGKSNVLKKKGKGVFTWKRCKEPNEYDVIYTQEVNCELNDERTRNLLRFVYSRLKHFMIPNDVDVDKDFKEIDVFRVLILSVIDSLFKWTDVCLKFKKLKPTEEWEKYSFLSLLTYSELVGFSFKDVYETYKGWAKAEVKGAAVGVLRKERFKEILKHLTINDPYESTGGYQNNY